MTTGFEDSAHRGLQTVRAIVADAAAAEEIGMEAGVASAEVDRRISMGLGEAAQTLRLLRGLSIDNGTRILEVGAGLGLACAALESAGLNVTALEPGGVGFDDHGRLAAAIRRRLGFSHADLSVSAEDLCPELHGRFDVIYSNNVIEHVALLGPVLKALSGVLTEGGVMIHGCPNYVVPFEPHFGIPLVPLRPQLTARLLPVRISSSELWASLNFLTASGLERAAAAAGLETRFRSGVLAASLERLVTDAEFRRRHPQLGRLAKVMAGLGVIRVAQLIPARWSTPLEVAMTRSASTSRLDHWVAGEPGQRRR